MRIYKLIITVSILLLFTNTFAQTVSNTKDTDITDRINFIQNELNDEKLYATTWTAGWTIFNGGSTAYFYYKGINTNNKADKVNNMVISAGSGLATIANIASPMVSMYASFFLQDMPETTRNEKLEKLSKAEDYLKSGSDIEEFGQSWISQSINLTTSAVAAYIVGSVYKDTMKQYGKNPKKEALVMFTQCFISGELQIYTQPMQLVKAQKKYTQKYGTPDNTPASVVTFFAYPEFAERRGIIAGFRSTF